MRVWWVITALITRMLGLNESYITNRLACYLNVLLLLVQKQCVISGSIVLRGDR